MPPYEYGRIATLAKNLTEAGIDLAISDQIMAGGEAIRKSTAPEKKADWLRDAMRRMDTLLDPETRYAVREACACCLGGKRLALVKAIAKNNAMLEERINAANEAKLVFGDSVTMQADGTVLVCFGPDGQPATYRCPCLPKATEPLPITYCYCCGGHVKHHLQIALGRKLSCRVRSSVLSSGGKKACSFLFAFEDSGS